MLLVSNAALSNDRLQAMFTNGMTHSVNGNYFNAAKEFRKMLAIDPSLTRPRLELALALYKSEDYEGAKYHFERVLASDISINVRNNVNAFLDKIKQELPAVSLSINLVTDTNPNQETSASTVKIGEFEFNLNEASQNKEKDGYQFIANTKIPISSKYKTFIKANLQHTDYSGKNNSQSYVLASLGRHYVFDNKSTLTPELGFHKFIHKDNSLYSGKTLSINYLKPINSTSHTELNLNTLEMNYPDFAHLDGWQHKLLASITKIPSPDNRWDFIVSYNKSELEDKTSSFKQPGVSLSSTQEFGDGWTIGATAKFSKKTYKKEDPFFGKIRKDSEKSAEITVLNRLFQINGISPRLHIGRIENSSNMNLYEFDRSYVKLEFTKGF